MVEKGVVEGVVGTFSASWLGVPLRTPSGAIGVLVVQHYEEENAYAEGDVEFLTSVAGQVAVAIERRRTEVALRRSEAELKKFASKLEASNRELQDFASVASHDLQEPLRKIQAFGDRLKTKYADALGEGGRDYLERMQNAASRMQTLINDLLTFSRVTTKAQPFVAVDLAEVAKCVVSDLEARVERSGGRVEMGEMLTLDADPLQMRQLLQNLIGNGLKFHKPDEPPLVKVWCERVASGGDNEGTVGGDLCRLFVEDNGIGFDEKYLDRIFTVFQRLHGRHQYEGTGVGLAVVRRIAERHGGSVTATSEPGRGSTFVVTLPVSQHTGESD